MNGVYTILIYPVETSCIHSWSASIHTAQVRYARHNVKVSRAKRRQSRELKGREEAREEWGDDGNDGHDRRVEEVKDQEQLLKHGIAHAEGEYDYQTERMGDMDADLRHELERENNEKWGSTEHAEGDNHEERGNEQETSDMEIESDSD